MINKFIVIIILILILFIFILTSSLVRLYIKNKTIRKIYDKIENYKFRHIFLIFATLVGIILFVIYLASDMASIYLIIYFEFIALTFIFIKQISEAINLPPKIKKWKFFVIIFIYLLIMIMYIHLFAQLYNSTFLLKQGYFLLEGKFYFLDTVSSYFISGITFLSYDVGFFPMDYMKLFIFLQTFFSQIMILGFVLIIFSVLLGKIKNHKI